MTALDYPLWLRATHFFDLLFLSLLVRSGIEIVSAHPRLYWNDGCTPGSEWLAFSKKETADGQLHTADDEERSFSSWIALPGHKHFDLGRHWHFLSVIGWVATGLVYVTMLLVSSEWRRLIPTSLHVVPEAWRVMLSYLSLHIVEVPGTYNPLQQLSYGAVVFLLAPLTIATGVAMSPAVSARFPWYIRIFHGRQGARSIHFLCLCAFTAFFVGHVTLVILHGLPMEMARIVLGETRRPHLTRALMIGLSGIAGIVLVHVAATTLSYRRPREVQVGIQALIDPLRTALFGHQTSRQRYLSADCSPYFWLNGRPPKEESYLTLARNEFVNYRLEVGGLIQRPLQLGLAQLRAMPKQTQITKHCCIQGWTGVAEWGGVPFRHIIDLCQPSPSARYAVFFGFDDKSTSEPHPKGTGYYYGTVRMQLAMHPETILAYEMNGQPLPVPHGAPLRLRLETQLGFKMVKYIRAIEFVADYTNLGRGYGGWPEDNIFRSQEAGI
jgi:DMSO/TMAO reductase YedYZ molybdopterin-dependent catalytic subunit